MRRTDSGHGACIGGSDRSSICSLASLPVGKPKAQSSYQLSAKQQGRKQDPRDLEVCGGSAQRRQMEWLVDTGG